jgi:hypothetical protein
MRRILILASAMSLSGCATIWRQPTTQAVFFDSTPLEARVDVDGAQRCVTMCTLKLERRRPHRVVLALNGYAPETTTVHRESIAKWFAADLTFGLGIGLVVDALSGRLYELRPDDINTSLKRR